MNQTNMLATAILIFRVAATMIALYMIYQALILLEYALLVRPTVSGMTIASYVQCYLVPMAASITLWFLAPILARFVCKSIKSDA